MIIFQIEIENPYKDFSDRTQLTVSNEHFHIAASRVNRMITGFDVANPATQVSIGMYSADTESPDHPFNVWLAAPAINSMSLADWLKKFGDIK